MTDDQTRKSSEAADDQSGLYPRIDEVAGERLAHPNGTGDQTTIDESQIIDDEAEELKGEPVPDATPDRADPQDMVVDDPQQLEQAEQVAARARSSRPVRRSKPQAQPGAASASEGHEVAARPAPAPRPVRRRAAPKTPAQANARSGAAQKGSGRTTPATFVSQSADELRKVIWPTGSQLSQYFVVVLLFVLFIVAYVGLLDPAFGWVVLKLLGN
ncbi:preprotein translocase subunit SecE [Luteococcus sp.]|uniref:preprotein translocase subunit SecE n=1 Tax=Luteococcus sp. TaxID=1969402 RepID=UPI003735CB4E